jgi:hypothetical protein
MIGVVRPSVFQLLPSPYACSDGHRAIACAQKHRKKPISGNYSPLLGVTLYTGVCAQGDVILDIGGV